MRWDPRKNPAQIIADLLARERKNAMTAWTWDPREVGFPIQEIRPTERFRWFHRAFLWRCFHCAMVAPRRVDVVGMNEKDPTSEEDSVLGVAKDFLLSLGNADDYLLSVIWVSGAFQPDKPALLRKHRLGLREELRGRLSQIRVVHPSQGRRLVGATQTYTESTR